ncbi:hypothetical protein [Candidatus Solincola sp.]|nr:hypothetical protein [Actinomycetota bacterium]
MGKDTTINTASEVGEYTLHNRAVIDDLEDEVEIDIVVREKEPEGERVQGRIE